MTTAEPQDKTLQLAPLTRCDHHAFAQVVFPQFLLSRSWLARYQLNAPGLPVIEMRELFPDGLIYDEPRYYLMQALFHLVEKAAPVAPDTPSLLMSDITVTLEEGLAMPLVLLTLTPVHNPPCVQFVALVATGTMSATAPQPHLRYFTCGQHTTEGAVVCEWIARDDGEITHQSGTLMGPPTKEAFVEALATLLA